MIWKEVRDSYPEKWLVIEAISARTKDNKRIVEELTVINSFDDSNEALKEYIQLHKKYPEKEMYVVHTSRIELDIEELTWSGVRTSR